MNDRPLSRRAVVVLVVMWGTLLVVGLQAGGSERRPAAVSEREALELSLQPKAMRARDRATLAQLGTGRSGGRAVAHRAGGRAAGAEGPAPEARQYSTERVAGEPTIGIASDGTIFYDGVSQFAPGGFDSGFVRSAPLRSRDGARTWEPLDLLVKGQDEDTFTLDPYIYLDRRTDRLFNVDFTPPCSVVLASDDQGETFETGEVCNHDDHQTIFAGPPPRGGAGPSGYPNVVYYCAIDGGVTVAATFTGCSKSLDGGTTFARTASPPYPIDPSRTGGELGVKGACTGNTGHGTVDDRGTVYLPRGYCDQPYLAISADEGDTWTRVQVSDLGVATGTQEVLNGAAVEDHEARVAVDPDGNVYYTWIARDHLPYLAVSRDGGKRFGRPLMVAAPGVNETWGPSLDVRATGRVAVSYMGTTNSPGGPFCARTTGPTSCETADGEPPKPDSAYADTTWNGYVGMSVDALASDPLFYSGTVNDPADPLIRGKCGIIQCQQEIDFLSATIGPDGTPWAAFVDGCPADPATDCPPLGIGIIGRLVGGPSLVERPGAGGGRPGPRACAATRAIASASVRRSGRRGLRIAFRRATDRPVTVDVFQQSIGRRVTGERLLARFADRARSFTWNGRANRRGRRVRDGILMVRLRARAADGRKLDTRRLVVRRARGRFSRRPTHFGRDLCRLVTKFKLERPVFGGTSGRSLGIAYRLAQDARVTVTIRRGGRIVRRYATVARRADRTYRLRLPARGTRRGDHRVTVRAVGGSSRQTRTLTSRRL